MAINDALSAVDVSTDIKDLSKLVKQFPVRDGEKPWTAREVKDIAEELTSDIDRLTSELAAADAELSDLLRNSGDGAGDDQADSGSSALEREQELTLVNNTRDLLAQTTRALSRISVGTFACITTRQVDTFTPPRRVSPGVACCVPDCRPHTVA